MAKAKAWEVTDEFWGRVEPLIPVRERVAEQAYTRKSGGGRKPKDPRLIFEGIVFVLRTGRHSRPHVTAVPAQSMHVFSNGKKRGSLKVSPGDGEALMGR